MEVEENPSKQKVKSCMADSWPAICEELRKYMAAVKDGQKHVALFVAHRTTVENIANAEIEETETFLMDADIKLKLQHVISKEMSSEENIISNICNNLDEISRNITKKFDRITSLYRSIKDSLSIEDMTEASEVSISFGEKLESLNNFLLFFEDSHLCRKFSVQSSYFTADMEQISYLWNTSDLETAEQDLRLMVFDEIIQ